MRETDLQELLTAAQSRVRGARILLARPRDCNMDQCVTLFREAQGYLEWARDCLPPAAPGRADMRRQAALLAAEVRHAGVLLDQGARAGRRWLQTLRPAAPEYTASGSPVPFRVRAQISFLG